MEQQPPSIIPLKRFALSLFAMAALLLFLLACLIIVVHTGMLHDDLLVLAPILAAPAFFIHVFLVGRAKRKRSLGVFLTLTGICIALYIPFFAAGPLAGEGGLSPVVFFLPVPLSLWLGYVTSLLVEHRTKAVVWFIGACALIILIMMAAFGFCFASQSTCMGRVAVHRGQWFCDFAVSKKNCLFEYAAITNTCETLPTIQRDACTSVATRYDEQGE